MKARIALKVAKNFCGYHRDYRLSTARKAGSIVRRNSSVAMSYVNWLVEKNK